MATVDDTFIALAGLPDVIKTGRSRISNPAKESADGTSFEGTVGNFDFKHQTKNFQGIQEILLDYNLKLCFISSRTFAGYSSFRASFTKFVAVTPNNEVVWYKYESGNGQAGQNHIYIHGRKIRTTSFLAYDKVARDKLFKV